VSGGPAQARLEMMSGPLAPVATRSTVLTRVLNLGVPTQLLESPIGNPDCWLWFVARGPAGETLRLCWWSSGAEHQSRG
jgi:hypothetical protein